MPEVKLSIIVPAYNEERLIAATLDCIRKALDGRPAQIIVCDNNSTDRTAELARMAGAEVVFEPVNQIARARNAGAARASGDWLVFVDADSCPSRALLADMQAAIASGRCIGGGSTVAFANPRVDVRCWVAFWNALSRTTGWAAGSFIFCEAAAFREAHGFDQTLFAAEEIDFSRRMKRLARRRRMRFVILRRHPLRTSDRKVRLYSPLEHLAFLLRFVTTGGRNLRRREACSIWYDGRR
ncbi:MAG: glycosyltransferase [Burkholderiales bacterium]|nr:glycosyltransferase [Burkholderiales bacterium]